MFIHGRKKRQIMRNPAKSSLTRKDMVLKFIHKARGPGSLAVPAGAMQRIPLIMPHVNVYCIIFTLISIT